MSRFTVAQEFDPGEFDEVCAAYRDARKRFDDL